MALLNFTAFTPQTMYAVCRTLQSLGGETDVETLQRWMSLSSIYGEDDRPKTVGLGLRESFGLCEALDIVTRSGSLVGLTDPLGSLDSFRRILRDRVLAPQRNAELFSSSPAGGVQAHEL